MGSFAVLILPRVPWRWSVLRQIGRGTLAAMGISLSTKGIDRIPNDGAMLVFNHSSYMDALVLTTVLPGEPAIVAKRELSDRRIAGPLLRRLGIPFVERTTFPAVSRTPRAWSTWLGEAGCWSSFRRAPSRGGRAFRDFIWARSRWRLKQTCRFSRRHSRHPIDAPRRPMVPSARIGESGNRGTRMAFGNGFCVAFAIAG